MMSLLILFLGCLVSAAEEPLLFSGKFNTIYLASKYMSITKENSEMRMLMREVKCFNQYTVMSMKFYVRNDGKCQLHTVWADKRTPQVGLCQFFRSIFRKIKCPNIEEIDFKGTWKLRHASRHFSKIYFHAPYMGGLPRKPSDVYIEIYFVSDTTILFEVEFINELNNFVKLTGALATGTNITQEMWKKYVKRTQQLGIPIGNIVNVYETDACPKLEL